MNRKPYFDDLQPLKGDQLNFKVYRALNAAQRLAFGDLGIELQIKIPTLTKAQAFHLTFKLVEWREKANTHLAPSQFL